MKLMSMKCPNCGGKLKYNKESSTIKCSYCQSEIVVHDENNEKIKKREVEKINNYLLLAERFFCDSEYNEALKKYEQVLDIDPSNYIAIFRRGLCISLMTNYSNFSIASSLNGFNNSLIILRNSELEYNVIVDIINNYAIDLLSVVLTLKNFAIDFYNSNTLNYEEVRDYIDRLLACLKVLECINNVYELNNNVKSQILKEILKLIEIIENKKEYADVYEIETGKPVILTYSMNRKNKNMLKNKKKKYLNLLLKISSKFKNKYDALKKQKLALVLLELVLITLFITLFIYCNNKIWSIILLMDIVLFMFDIFSKKLIKDNQLFFIIKIIIAIIAVIGFFSN